MDCYSVSPDDFCLATVFPHVFFLIIFVDFFFNIEQVENLTLTFPTCFFPIFFYFFAFFFVFYIELVENYKCRFPHETILIATVFLCMVSFPFVFFCYDFF